MCKTIPAEASLEAPKAQMWDGMALARWLNDNVPVKQAHQLLEMAIAGSYEPMLSVDRSFLHQQMPTGVATD
jgi:monoamine oxidase